MLSDPSSLHSACGSFLLHNTWDTTVQCASESKGHWNPMANFGVILHKRSVVFLTLFCGPSEEDVLYTEGCPLGISLFRHESW